jgi:hypothetical protein
VSENFRGLGFPKDVQWYIYRGTTIATCAGDVTRSVATEDLTRIDTTGTMPPGLGEKE